MKTKWLLAAALVFCLASASAGEGAVIPNSLHDARVGEWTLYKTQNGYTQKHTVVKVDGTGPSAAVAVRIDNIYNGEVVDSHEVYHEAGGVNHPIKLPEGRDAKIEVSTKDVTVKGKTIRATVVELERDDDEMEWYLSDEVPVFGMIKQISDDDLEYDLIDYGNN